MEENKLQIDCNYHGKGIASIVCCHHLSSVDPVGFIENNSDPDDLQGWCYACEYLFQEEGEITKKFQQFNNAKMVCEKCYKQYKDTHWIQ